MVLEIETLTQRPYKISRRRVFNRGWTDIASEMTGTRRGWSITDHPNTVLIFQSGMSWSRIGQKLHTRPIASLYQQLVRERRNKASPYPIVIYLVVLNQVCTYASFLVTIFRLCAMIPVGIFLSPNDETAMAFMVLSITLRDVHSPCLRGFARR